MLLVATLYDLINKSNEVLKAYKKMVARNIVLPFLKMSAKSLKNIGEEYKKNSTNCYHTKNLLN